MRVLVVGAAPYEGAEEFYRFLLGRADAVVAADAAGEWCQGLGRAPDVAVGDFDSAAHGAEERLGTMGADVRTAPSRKNVSDLDLAVDAARSLGATHVAFTAAFSMRVDHTLAALGTLASAADLHAVALEPDLAAWPLDARTRPSLAAPLPVGTTVSVFAFGAAAGVTLGGFEYPLHDATLEPLSSLGLSNVTTAPEVEVRLAEGTLVVLANAPVARQAAAGEWVYW